jgi:pilus assembly protein Flp/PilA
MLAMYLWLKNWFEGEEGQDLIEYALIIALLVVAAAAALTLTGNAINTLFGTINTWLGTHGAS